MKISKKQLEEAKRIVRYYGRDILASKRFERGKHITHHGVTTVSRHCFHVAVQACLFAGKAQEREFSVSMRDVVRAALLHDVGMTEKRVFKSLSCKKAYTHPWMGGKIAAEEFGASPIVQDAIRHHMWPICVIPPRHLAGWILILSDKTCARREFRKCKESRRKKAGTVSKISTCTLGSSKDAPT